MDFPKPCRRCLLEQAGETDLAKSVAERVALIPEENRAEEKLYRKRLEICRGCDFLISGVCGKCGCYVEIRAARLAGYCPAAKPLW